MKNLLILFLTFFSILSTSEMNNNEKIIYHSGPPGGINIPTEKKEGDSEEKKDKDIDSDQEEQDDFLSDSDDKEWKSKWDSDDDDFLDGINYEINQLILKSHCVAWSKKSPRVYYIKWNSQLDTAYDDEIGFYSRLGSSLWQFNLITKKHKRIELKFGPNSVYDAILSDDGQKLEIKFIFIDLAFMKNWDNYTVWSQLYDSKTLELLNKKKLGEFASWQAAISNIDKSFFNLKELKSCSNGAILRAYPNSKIDFYRSP